MDSTYLIRRDEYLSSLFTFYQAYSRDDIVRLLEGPEEALLSHLEKATELTLHPSVLNLFAKDPFSLQLERIQTPVSNSKQSISELGDIEKSTSRDAEHVRKALSFAKPVMPLLRSVTLDAAQVVITGVFVDAMEADHFPNLETLAISFDGRHATFDQLQELTRLFKSIEAGHVPRLKQLTFVGMDVLLHERKAVQLAVASGNLSALQRFTLYVTGEGFTTAAETKLVEAIKSGRLGALQSLTLPVTVWVDLASALEEGSLPSLQELRLTDSFDFNFATMAAEVTARALANGVMPALSLLAMSDNDIGNRGAIALAEGLQACSPVSLQSLILRNCGISSSPCEGESGGGVFALAQLFKSGHLNDLEILDMSDNDIGERGAIALAEGLQACSQVSLKSLCLRKCGISSSPSGGESGAGGLLALAQLFKSGHLNALEKLDMGGNPIGDSGVIALAESLQASSQVSLNSLSLRYCEIFTSSSKGEGRRGVPALAQLLKSGHLNTLEVLDLGARDKSCDCASVDAIVAAFYENTSLTTSVELYWGKFPDEGRQYRKFRDRNLRNKQVWEGLKDEEMVQALGGKLLLCGHPFAGKTTLINTLCRSRRRSILTFETKPRLLPRTRGIEVTQMERRDGVHGVDLVVWDMAGQEEYQLVHNAFLPEFTLADGEATTFVIVCKTSVELEYWLRFVASSCFGGFAKRHVVVVVNLIDGKASSEDWEFMMKSLSDKFKSYLTLYPMAFMVDVRRRWKVEALRNHLLQHTISMSRNRSVPGICETIQTATVAWTEENMRFPVLSWDDYVLKVRQFPMNHTLKTLRSATEFLHEAGHLIFFRPGFVKEGGNVNKGMVILDPGWFCSKVVGNLVLPEKLLLPQENPIRVGRDDSIPVSKLQRYFTTFSNNTWSSWEVDDFVSVLLGVGLCYRVDGDRLLFPARIAKDDVVPEDLWRDDSQGYNIDNDQNQWVMGYSLWRENEITVLPMALFCRLQVELGQNPRFNDGEPNSKYHCGKTYVTFRASHMAVLIYVRPSTKDDYVFTFEDQVPTFDRVDVLVKPLVGVEQDIVNVKIRRECQVDLARAIVEMLMELCANIYPRVTLVNNVVIPFSTSKSFMSNVEVMEVKKVKELVQKGGLDHCTNFVVNGEFVKWEDFLSNKELEEIGVSIDEQCNLAKQGVTMGVFPTSVLEILSSSTQSREEPFMLSVHAAKHKERASSAVILEDADIGSEGKDFASAAVKPSTISAGSELCASSDDMVTEITMLQMGKGSQSLLLRRMSRLEQLVQSKVDQSTLELRKYLHEILRVQQSDGQHFKFALAKLGNVVHTIQGIERFSIEERERSLPRFMFLAKRNDPGVWMTLKQAIESSSVLHLMCEARYNTQVMHEVEGQDGLDTSELKDWVKKILPWVKFSMIAIWFTATTMGNFVAPGMGLLLNSNTQGPISQLSGAIAALTGLSYAELDKQVMVGTLREGAPSKGAPSLGEVNVIIRQLLGDLKPFEFLQKFGLIKVLLHTEKSSSSVVWICKDCHSKYRSRVRDL